MQTGTARNPRRGAPAGGQIAVRLDGERIAELDMLVSRGVYASRADAVRFGLALVWRRWQQAQIASAYERGYGAHPQEGDDLETWSRGTGTSALAGLEE